MDDATYTPDAPLRYAPDVNLAVNLMQETPRTAMDLAVIAHVLGLQKHQIEQPRGPDGERFYQRASLTYDRLRRRENGHPALEGVDRRARYYRRDVACANTTVAVLGTAVTRHQRVQFQGHVQKLARRETDRRWLVGGPGYAAFCSQPKPDRLSIDLLEMGLTLARRFLARAELEQRRQRFFGRGRKHVAILSSKDDELTEVRP